MLLLPHLHSPLSRARTVWTTVRGRWPERLERIPIMLQYILHERRIWRHFGGQPSHELTDAAAKRIPETESPAKTPPFRTPWKSRFNPNGNRSNDGHRDGGGDHRMRRQIVSVTGRRARPLDGRHDGS